MADISLTAPDDYVTQMAKAQRQQQLAQALQQLGQEPIQAQSAGGITAPISPLSILAKALNSFGGSYEAGQANKSQIAARQADLANTTKAMQNLYQTAPNITTSPVATGGAPAPNLGDPNNPAMAGINGVALTGSQYGYQAPRPTTPQEQMQSAAQMMGGGPVSQGMGGAVMQNAMKNQQTMAQNAMSLPAFIQAVNQNVPAPQRQGIINLWNIGPTGPTMAEHALSGYMEKQLDNTVQPPDELTKKAAALFGKDYASNPQYQPWLQQQILGTKSPERQKQDIATASAEAAARQRAAQGTINTSDPITQSWVASVLNGNATMQQVPMALRNSVAMAMHEAPKEAYSPLASSRMTMAANRIVGNYIKLPQYQLTANGLPYLQRIDAALKVPGSVSDQDLLDSLTKLNTAGNAVTDAQVKIITDGKSFADWAGTVANKFKNGGVLSENQRHQIHDIANNIYENYSKGYQPVYDQATKQLEDAGIPKAFWTIPDLNNLSDGMRAAPPPGGGSTHPANLPAGSLYSPSRQQYKTPDGRILDKNGNPVP